MNPRPLPDEMFVMLDPDVEILPEEIAEYRLLCHGHFEVGMVVPPGEGLVEFVTALMGKPIRVGALRAEYDDQQLLDQMLASLSGHGFLHVTSPTAPAGSELEQLRNLAGRNRQRALRRRLAFDLDAHRSVQQMCADLDAEANPPEVLLRCARVADHKLTLAELAQRRQTGAVRMHETVLQTADLTCDTELCRSLIRLGAAVHLEGVPWPAPERPVPGLAEMTRHCVAVHALMAPDLSILDETARERALSWAGSVFLSGLGLRLEAEALWPAAEASEDAFIRVFNAVRELEDKFGDVRITNLPGDEVLLGRTLSHAGSARRSGLAGRFCRAYLRWRLPFLKSYEADNTWSQIPEAEEKLVRPLEDLLPNHPELLRLRPGSLVVDVCGGLGRVARRLAPAVGREGLIISIEMLRCLSQRARQFAGERNLTNLDFRTGLAQRLPLRDGVADAAVNEWTGGIWELGIGAAMVGEMARVVRPGGRIAVTHRLVRLPLTRLGEPWVQYERIYDWMREAFARPTLTIIAERIWGQVTPSLVGENATHWRKQYMPRLVNPHDVIYESDDGTGVCADVLLTIIAQRQ